MPTVLFGLPIGALTDRVDRRRLMVLANVLSALAIASLPLAAALGALTVPLIFLAVFVEATLAIATSAGRFGALPSLVAHTDLVRANGRIQASFAAASILGPLSAGALLVVASLEQLLLIDAASFLVAALAVACIGRPLRVPRAPTSIKADVVEGVRYVMRDPILRNIAVMMAIVNFIRAPAGAQLVLFAKERYAATDAQVSILFVAAAIGALTFSVAAGRVRDRWPFAISALGALALSGVMYIGLAIASEFWVAVACWGLASGLGVLFNIGTASLRQALVPAALLGRVFTVAFVLTVWTGPLGSLLSGVLLERPTDLRLAYALVGAFTALVPLLFWRFTPLRTVDASRRDELDA
jgi:MFS family permease